MEVLPAPFMAFKAIAETVSEVPDEEEQDAEEALVPYLYLVFIINLLRGDWTLPAKKGRLMMPVNPVPPCPYVAAEALCTALSNLEAADDENVSACAYAEDDVISAAITKVLDFLKGTFAPSSPRLKKTTSRDYLARTRSHEDLAQVAGFSQRIFARRTNNTVRLRNAL